MQQPDYSHRAYYPLPTSTLAIISLVAGILSFIAFPLLGSAVAIFAGYQARKETRAVPPLASGDGLATTGIILGWINIVLAMLGLCCVLIYFLFIAGLIASGQ